MEEAGRSINMALRPTRLEESREVGLKEKSPSLGDSLCTVRRFH